MYRNRSNYRAPGLLLTTSLAVLLLLGLATVAAAEGSATFVGDETCLSCHDQQAETYDKSLHAQAWSSKGGQFKQNGCESCHGPGSAHAESNDPEDIRSYSGKAMADDNSACLSCHQSSPELALWKSGAHAENDVSCASCHTIHEDDKPAVKEPETCFSCHRDIKFDSNKRSHHPIIEDKVSCSDCHNPHGSFSESQLRADSTNELCYSCHAEKRGPFLWEHPPVEENCLTCHTSHGSRHNNLLTSRVPNLCQDCHDWSRHPGSAYDATNNFSGSGGNRFIARSCLNCHTTIHGSNAPQNPDSGYNGGHYFVR